MKVRQQSPSKTPSLFFLPRPTGVFQDTYDENGNVTGQEEIIAYDLENEELIYAEGKAFKRKCINGTTDIHVYRDSLKIYENNILKCSYKLRAELFHNGTWKGKDFVFSEAEVKKKDNKTIRAWEVQDIPALGIVGAIFGIEAQWAMKDIGLRFYVKVDGYLVRLKWIIECDDLSYMDFKYDDYVGNSEIETVGTITTVTYEPLGVQDSLLVE